MNKNRRGFTLIELLVVIAIIGVLASILLPTLNYVQYRAKVATVKTTITQMAQALKAYQNDYGVYPPNAEGSTEGPATTVNVEYSYCNGAFVPYLDGDTSTMGTNGGASKIQYFEFKEQDRDGNRYRDGFEGYYWYHNMQADNMNQKDLASTQGALHPWYISINFRSFQIYSKIDYPTQAYEDGVFKWVTNYSD